MAKKTAVFSLSCLSRLRQQRELGRSDPQRPGMFPGKSGQRELGAQEHSTAPVRENRGLSLQRGEAEKSHRKTLILFPSPTPSPLFPAFEAQLLPRSCKSKHVWE